MDIERKALLKKIAVLLPISIVMVGAILFLPANTINFWQAWVYLAVIFIPYVLIISYFLKYDPELLKRRMQYKEKNLIEKKVMILIGILGLIAFIIPGLDHKYGWSSIPVGFVIISDLMIILGYGIIFIVFKKNSYTSRIIEIMKNQKVITTGPYGIIRHPMYLGMIILCGFTPSALGSWWAIIPMIPMFPLLIIRIYDEEKLLQQNLKGYKEYMQKVKYRLLPYVW